MIAEILIGLIALEHFGFMVLEMFLWTRPAGRRIFATTPEFAESSRVLAANQGLYNGILAAGLVWASLGGAAGEVLHLRVFFLIAVVVAGLFGGLTVKKSILFVQALPALVALGIVLAT